MRMDIAINAVCGRVHELIEANVLEEGDPCKCPITGRRARPVGVTARYKQKDLFGDAA